LLFNEALFFTGSIYDSNQNLGLRRIDYVQRR
jgi:hypothetical protein